MSSLLDNLLLFGRILRRAGVEVHSARMLDLADALALIGFESRDDVYHACRTLLVHRPGEIPLFDRAFDAFWRVHTRAVAPDVTTIGNTRDDRSVSDDLTALGDFALAADEERTEHATPTAPAVRTWSDTESLSRKDFATLTARELSEARAALSRLVWNPGERRTRRWIRGRGPRLDIRRGIAESIRTGGDVITLRRLTRRLRPRPLVLLCDVSGSMERYSRMLLHFAHAITARHRRVEAFLFSTQLTRVTRQWRLPRAADALAAVSRAVPDWSGGTRIGAAVKAFHQRWSRRVLTGGPVVLLISDGWDRGDPSELADQIARLHRSCHRLIWLNPLIGTTDYAPLTRGLQAALPFVDDFLPARTLTNLVDLATHLNALA